MPDEVEARDQQIDLTEEQEAILNHPPTRHARILAGPGAGKSYTAVAYLRHWQEQQPDLRIRMITFTRAATNEFAEKLAAPLGNRIEASPMTIHSFALRLLHTLGGNVPRPVRIPNTVDVDDLIRPMIQRQLKALGHHVTLNDVKDLELEMAAGWQSMNPDVPLLAEENPEMGNAYRGVWAEHRERFGYTLLAELPYQAAVTLEDVGGPGDLDVDLLIVDEYQDLNEADIHLIRRTADLRVAVLVIGDDDQSIYRWRKAAPEGIRRFCEEFAPADDFQLTLSRRCGRTIIEAANEVIQTSPDRPNKPVLRPRAGAPAGDFAYLRFNSEADEAKGIAAIVRARVDAGVEPEEILILVRSRVPVWRDVLTPAFEEVGLTLSNAEWVPDVLKEEGIRKAIAISYLAQERYENDSLAWLSLARGLTPRVGDAFVDYVLANSREGERFGPALMRLYEEGFPNNPPSSARHAASTIRETRARIQSLNLDGVVLGEHGWGDWIRDTFTDDLSSDAVRLLEMVGAQIPEEPLDRFLAQLEPLGKDLAAKETGGVRLMTMAGSKGLTVNTAIIAGVEDSLIPMPPPKGDRAEEIRLLYVALTRATEMCVMTFASRRFGRLARQGAGRTGNRQRSPLVQGLRMGQPQDGNQFIRQLTSVH